jgi:uncharacterized membrane protein YfcA
MKRIKKYGAAIAGAAAGAVNGLFGAGGGMILVPLLARLTDIEEDEIFPSSISIILPICIVSLTFIGLQDGLPLRKAFPYLIGSATGGILAGLWGKHIPTKWLHRILGLLIIWGGFRYL